MPATTPGRHMVTTQPRPGRCPRCRRIVLNGIADGMSYSVDPTPVTLPGEIHHRVAGRMTYRLLAGRFFPRDANDIALDARHGRPPVAPTHTCTRIDPSHIEPKHAPLFAKLTEEIVTVESTHNPEQYSLLVVSGEKAGMRVVAIPADDDPPF